jgi:alpha-ketoglutarate-dependent taurine dioxygenase
MWNVKARVILVMIGATETISKSLRQYLRNIPGKHEIKELKKKVLVLATARTTEITNAISTKHISRAK